MFLLLKNGSYYTIDIVFSCEIQDRVTTYKKMAVNGVVWDAYYHTKHFMTSARVLVENHL